MSEKINPSIMVSVKYNSICICSGFHVSICSSSLAILSAEALAAWSCATENAI